MSKKRIFGFAFIVVFAIFMLFGKTIVIGINDYIDNKKIIDNMPNAVETELFNKELDKRTYYYYNRLTDEQKIAYITVYSEMIGFEESRRIAINSDEIEDVFVAVLYDNPQIFWVDSNYEFYDYEDSVQLNLKYRNTEAEAAEINKNLYEKLSQIMSSIDDNASDYQIEKYFHDYVCENTVYDETTYGNIGNTAYSSLLDGKSICEGYARAMQILLDSAGIRNYVVIGDGVTEEGTDAHMWNIVEIDGENYHLDATWNDTSMDDRFGYMYFNVTDDFISDDHINIVPADNNCISTKYNYFVMNNLYVEDFNSLNDLINPVSDALKNDDNFVEILFSNEKELAKVMNIIEKDNFKFFNFIEKTVRKSGKNFSINEIEYLTIDEHNYLCLIYKEG